MNFKWTAVFLTVVSLVLTSCTTSPTSPNGSGNLIRNWTFRSGNEPSLAGWQIADTSRVKVVANAPTGSGTWSIWLAPQVGPSIGGLASTSVTGLSGRSVYALSGWERNFAGWYWGNATLGQIRNGSLISYKSWTINDTTWTPFFFADTLDMLPTDTIVIGLNAPSYAVIPEGGTGSADIASSGVIFNGLSLTKQQ